jgi:hypothetical protein
MMKILTTIYEIGFGPERSRRSLDFVCIPVQKTFPGRVRGTADPSASLGMTKGRVVVP